MAARSPRVATPLEDFRRLQAADRIAHGAWDPARPPRLSRLERVVVVACAVVAVFGGWFLVIVLFLIGGGSGDAPR